MRKLVFTLALLLTLGHTSYSQQDPNAKRVLDAMKSKYEGFSAFKISVVQQVLNASNKVMSSLELKATVKKNKYKIELADQIIYNNERTIWRYLPDEDEVTIHNNNSDEEGEDLFQSPSNLFKLYKDGFKYKMVGTDKVGNISCDVVELAPIDRDKFDFFKVKLYISKTDKTLRQWVVFEKDADTMQIIRYQYKVTNFNSNIKVTDQHFSFNVPSNIDIIDLRE